MKRIPPLVLLPTMLALSLSLVSMGGCSQTGTTTQPTIQLSPQTILTLEKAGYALASAEVANAHARGQLTGVSYDGAIAGLAALKQQIADNSAAVAAGKSISMVNLDNDFNAALNSFLDTYINSISPVSTVPTPAP